MSTEQRLRVGGLSKTFGSAQVLKDVALTVAAGEIHGLAGQNGSGKSTLIKVLTGFHPPDTGASYEVDGRRMAVPVKWRDVHAAGVAVVYQNLGLLDQLSVAENICVGGFPTARFPGRIDRRGRDRLAAATLARLGVDVDPTALVETLSAAERAEVAIARAMRDHTPGSGLIILDESTRALSGADLARVHALLRRLTTDGSAVLMISHNLVELVTVADRVTVLADGRVVGSGLATSKLSEPELARLMLGGAVNDLAPREPAAAEVVRAPAVTVSGLTGRRLRDLDFEVGRGEIVGITGLPGSGYEDIPYLLTGAQPALAGRVVTPTATVELAKATVARCLRAGMVLVPERRDRDGLAVELSMQDNVSLPALRGNGRGWFVGRRWQREATERAVADLDIRPRQPHILIKALSGGNQQKVLLAKWLQTGPSLIVLHEPTQAVDVGARTDILRAVQHAAAAGTSILLVSSEAEDLLAVCDRILVLRDTGRLEESGALSAEQLIEGIYSHAEATRSLT